MPARRGTRAEPAGREPAGLRIEGTVALRDAEQGAEELALKAVAFDRAGQVLGAGDVDEKGGFGFSLDLAKPAQVELLVGPDADPDVLRKSAVYQRTFTTEDWADKEVLRAQVDIAREIWWPWRPIRICVSGRVRKVGSPFRLRIPCAVPFTKVEIFDVDREGCWWPFIVRHWPDLIDRPVIRIPELIEDRPIPKPPPGPGPIELSRLVGGGQELELGAPAGAMAASFAGGGEDLVALNPQPIPPGFGGEAMALSHAAPHPPHAAGAAFAAERSSTAGFRAGEAGILPAAMAAKVENLTLTSVVPPWEVFPRCFYSKRLVCEATTDCEGSFTCCFNWWPIHWRGGRLRFDSRPDIIVRVTQVIDGVETVVYLDPYTSTRWNITSAYLDLHLDDPRVRCGSPDCPPPQPRGPVVFYTLLGMDEVYKIDQASGLYPNVAAPGIEPAISNLAYGSTLRAYANFGTGLTTGSPQRYYRLSFAPKTGPATPPDAAFNPITTPAELWDTRVDKSTLVSTTHKLGPYLVGAQPGLYEVRNMADYYWYNPNLIGSWLSWIDQQATGAYVLRLEVFDNAGNKLTTASGLVDYRDGTVPPVAVLPSMTDHCDLVVLLDNKGIDDPVLTSPAVNDCGVVPWVPNLSLTFGLHVQQGHGRLHSWGFYYTKGVDPTPHGLASGSSTNGAPDPVNQTVVVGPAHPMISGLSTTCAYALKLWGVAHVTDGSHDALDRHNYPFYNEILEAIAIEKCS